MPACALPSSDATGDAGAGSPFEPRWKRWLARFDDGSTYVLTRFAVLRLLGVVYFVAFVSSLLQARALIGDDGLLPMRGYLRAIAHATGGSGSGFLRAPSFFWIDASDVTLAIVCGLGAVLAFAVACGVTNALVMVALWMVQFSLVSVGQTFWSFGWEIQLLETGMLAAFCCPVRTIRPLAASAPPTIVIWLLRWLIVRVMLGAGMIKLRGDPCWRELTCLVTHYETQPNPSPMSWVLNQMPAWFHSAGVLFNHFVELFVPIFAFGPRRVRHVAGGLMVAFQGILIASGNLSFLNWLTIVPALACFDDTFWIRFAPKRSRTEIMVSAARPPSRTQRRAVIAYAALVGVLSIQPIANLFSSSQTMNGAFDPLYLVNTYGAFGSINRTRDEIILEGTTDTEVSPTTRWEEYEFPCKPGDVFRRPCLVTPYHYRLDWQMWFAAMSSYDEEPWLVVLVDKLLRGNRTVTRLLAKNPFPDRPPHFVRAQLYRYELTRWGEGPAWWKRRLIGEYMRPLSADDPDLRAFLRAHRFAE